MNSVARVFFSPHRIRTDSNFMSVLFIHSFMDMLRESPSLSLGFSSFCTRLFLYSGKQNRQNKRKNDHQRKENLIDCKDFIELFLPPNR